MTQKANELDELGFFKEADKIDRFITAQFKLKKRKINPLITIQNQLNGLSGKLDEFINQEGGNDASPEEKDFSVTVDNKPVKITEE